MASCSGASPDSLASRPSIITLAQPAPPEANWLSAAVFSLFSSESELNNNAAAPRPSGRIAQGKIHLGQLHFIMTLSPLKKYGSG
jgi:hypothetical protein